MATSATVPATHADGTTNATMPTQQALLQTITAQINANRISNATGGTHLLT